MQGFQLAYDGYTLNARAIGQGVAISCGNEFGPDGDFDLSPHEVTHLIDWLTAWREQNEKP